MIKSAALRPIRFVLVFYLACMTLRGIEYLVLRTDQSVIGEAFVHKVAGIALMAAALSALGYTWAEIGFRTHAAVRHTLDGLLMGGGVFAVAYATEMLLQRGAGNAPGLRFYVTSYAVQGNRGMETGALFILICLAGNVINVVMEEGVFRGLFPRLMQERYGWTRAILLASVLFGLWHIAGPLRTASTGSSRCPAR